MRNWYVLLEELNGDSTLKFIDLHEVTEAQINFTPTQKFGNIEIFEAQALSSRKIIDLTW